MTFVLQADLVTTGAIFKKKIGSGTHSDPKFGRGEVSGNVQNLMNY
jgi:hypothetical protein